MNKMLSIAVLSLLAHVGSYAHEEAHSDECMLDCYPDEKVLLIDFVDIREAKAEELLSIMEGKKENIALHFPSGIDLPLKPKIEGDFFELNSNEADLSLHIKRDFYVRVHQGDFLFSSDLKEWEALNQFVTGSITVGLIKEDFDPIFALIEAQLNDPK